MRLFEDDILLSASDLNTFIGCPHATTLDLAYLHGEGPEPREDSDDVELLQNYGFAHENNYLDRLQSQGRRVLGLTGSDFFGAVIATRDAMQSGVDVIYQGALMNPHWGGWADFIELVEKPSALGNYSYEVVDTKLKRSVDPRHVLQLVLYSDLLAEIQGIMPEYAHVELGNGERATLRLSDYMHYARNARRRLEAFVETAQPTRPIPCTDCSLCRWADHCSGIWQSEDSLFNVANIARSQVKKLETAGVGTMAGLAVHDGAVRGMPPQTLDKLKAQARLQHARQSGGAAVRVAPRARRKGVCAAPRTPNWRSVL